MSTPPPLPKSCPPPIPKNRSSAPSASTNIVRGLMLVISALLGLVAALKVYVVFKRPEIGPELIADATMLSMSAVALFVLAKKLGKK